MRSVKLLPLLVAGLAPGVLMAQESAVGSQDQLGRSDRVVLYSPHFDTPLPRWEGLSCPSGPLHLYGFEGSKVDGTPSLQVRVFMFDPTRLRDHVLSADGPREGVLTPLRAQVRLTHLIGPEGEAELFPRPGWATVTDEAGGATLTTSPGVYRLRVEWGSEGENEGIVRVRAARSDSIHAYVMPGAICEQQ